MSSWDCFTRRKRVSSREPNSSHSAPARQICFEPKEQEQVNQASTPTINASRFTLLSRIERAFRPTQLVGQTSPSHPTPKTSNVWCTTSLNGAPALGVQLPSPIRPQSILLYDRSSAQDLPHLGMRSNSSPLNKLQWPQETPPAFTKGIKRLGAPSMLILNKPTRPEAQAVLDHKGCLTTSDLVRQSQYAVVSEVSPITSQPRISPEPTPREELTSFLSSSNPNSSRSTNSNCTSPSSLYYRPALPSRYAERKLPPPTPPPTIPLPPLPAPPAARLNQETIYSDQGIAFPIHFPRSPKALVSDHIRRDMIKHPSRLPTTSLHTPPTSSSPNKTFFPYSGNVKQIPPRIRLTSQTPPP
ncbi:hypothetical protein DFH28DRAFT_1117123 [Melampsora americana]|nr:hypothetical protein DFH28DRAFT_1117123 [Melampsora americana]